MASASVGSADQVVPAIDRDLAGDEGSAAAVAVFDDLEQVAALLGPERLEAPVVEDQQLDTAERAHQTRVAAVAAGEREIGEQPGHALVEDRAVVAAGLVPEGAGQPALADAGRAFDDQVLRAPRSSARRSMPGTTCGRGHGRRGSRRPRRTA